MRWPSGGHRSLARWAAPASKQVVEHSCSDEVSNVSEQNNEVNEINQGGKMFTKILTGVIAAGALSTNDG